MKFVVGSLGLWMDRTGWWGWLLAFPLVLPVGVGLYLTSQLLGWVNQETQDRFWFWVDESERYSRKCWGVWDD